MKAQNNLILFVFGFCILNLADGSAYYVDAFRMTYDGGSIFIIK